MAQNPVKQNYLVFVRHRDEGDHFHLYGVSDYSEASAIDKVRLAFDLEFALDEPDDWRFVAFPVVFREQAEYLLDVEHLM